MHAGEPLFHSVLEPAIMLTPVTRRIKEKEAVMRRISTLAIAAAVVVFAAPTAESVTSPCEECHAKLQPLLVKDFNRGAMAETMTCVDCHGENHVGDDDAEKAELPTIATC
jgi:hypothetical protein